jgi:acylphosphatase
VALIKSAVCGLRAAPGVPEIHEARRYFISGMVQGVGFRYFALRAAERLGVTGYVKNLRDGRVEVYAIGGHRALSLLRAELERGPRAAVVSSVTEDEAPLDAHFAHSFSIEHDAW